MRFALVTFFLIGCLFAAERKPDILFIAVDDLNDWISPMGGNSQTVTPNFDRLAASGTPVFAPLALPVHH